MEASEGVRMMTDCMDNAIGHFYEQTKANEDEPANIVAKAFGAGAEAIAAMFTLAAISGTVLADDKRMLGYLFAAFKEFMDEF